MKSSLQILQGIPDFETHQLQLQRFQERLDGMTRPQLLQAFNSRDIGA